MKSGKTLVELAQEIERQSSEKKDVIFDTRSIGVRMQDNVLELPEHGEVDINDNAHRQISQRTGIPKRYYDRMKSDTPELLNANVRQWFDDEPERRMVRTLDGHARAFLSDRYRIVDNDQILYQALPALRDSGMELLSSEVTDNNLYLQARFPRLEGEVKVNDPVQMGLIIRNSEVGLGAISILPMVYRLVCTNGMVTGSQVKEGKFRAAHLGRQLTSGDDHIVYADDTREAYDRALMLRIRDAVTQLSDPELFYQLVAEMKRAADTPATQDPVKAVEVVTKAYSVPESEKNKILENFLSSSDRTLWGMSNAVTATANDHASYDRAIELEELGGQIMGMGASRWESIAKAA